MVNAMGELLGNQQLDERVAEIKAIMERMDFRWDEGLILDRDEYLEKRVKLQQELEQLTPIPDDELERAADVLENFSTHWDAIKHDREAQEKLVHLIVARVWVKGSQVVAISLRPNYHVTIGFESKKPTEVSVGFIHGRERRAWIAHWVHNMGPKRRSLSSANSKDYIPKWLTTCMPNTTDHVTPKCA